MFVARCNSSFRQLILHAPHGFALKAHLNHGVDQVSSREVLNRSFEESPLQGRNYVWNENDKAGVKIHFPEKLDEVHAVVCDEREFVFDDPLCQRPVRLAAQAEVVDVGCLETGGMGQPD